MINFKTVLVFVVFASVCYGQPPGPGFDRYDRYNKKHHHHHHGMNNFQFLYYLTFLAIKLKIMFFLGTIFTISLVAGKVIAIIKLTEYMKKKNNHHEEEKIVYVNPHEHHDIDFGGYPGGYGSSSDIYNGKTYPGAYPTSDISLDQPPNGAYEGHERYEKAPLRRQQARNTGDENEMGIFTHFALITSRIRQLNITDMALNEMGIKEEQCKREFVCKADFNARKNPILRAGFEILRDISYHKYKTNSTVESEEHCKDMYPLCNRTMKS